MLYDSNLKTQALLMEWTVVSVTDGIGLGFLVNNAVLSAGRVGFVAISWLFLVEIWYFVCKNTKKCV